MSDPFPDVDAESSLPLWRELREVSAQLPRAVRDGLAQQWVTAASFEHASVASFNRFSLELLSIGAPADLVSRANQAALEEVRHARHCFAIASIYAGVGLGPGPLDLNGLQLRRADLAVLCSAATEEGCVGETLAAAEAAAAAEYARPPLLCAVLAAIARDEAEHAALAYRFVRWAIEVGGDSVRASARESFDIAVRRAQAPSQAPGGESELWPEHGRLLDAQRAAVRRASMVHTLEPAGRTLFSMKN